MKLIFAPGTLNGIQRHGEESYPEEGAGLLLGKLQDQNRKVTDLMPLDNTFEGGKRKRRYLISPEAMIEAEERAEALGLEILGVFHSHPDHPAQPSEFDRTWAWPWFAYVITSIQNGQSENSRAWLLKEDRSGFDEITLQAEHFQEVS